MSAALKISTLCFQELRAMSLVAIPTSHFERLVLGGRVNGDQTGVLWVWHGQQWSMARDRPAVLLARANRFCYVTVVPNFAAVRFNGRRRGNERLERRRMFLEDNRVMWRYRVRLHQLADLVSDSDSDSESDSESSGESEGEEEGEEQRVVHDKFEYPSAQLVSDNMNL